MKKIIAFMLVLMLVFNLSGCIVWTKTFDLQYGKGMRDLDLLVLGTVVIVGIIKAVIEVSLGGSKTSIPRKTNPYLFENDKSNKAIISLSEEELDSLMRTFYSLPDKELNLFVGRLNSMSKQETISLMESIDSLSEKKIAAMFQTFNTMQETEIISSLDALNSLPKTVSFADIIKIEINHSGERDYTQRSLQYN